MHREHSAYSNPTCALRAPFVSHTFHSCFDLCRAREGNAQTPNKSSGDNPSALTKLTTQTQCIPVRRFYSVFSTVFLMCVSCCLLLV